MRSSADSYLVCLDRGISLDELPLEKYRKEPSAFDEDIYEAIKMESCVDRRNTYGAPGLEVMDQVISECRSWLFENMESPAD